MSYNYNQLELLIAVKFCLVVNSSSVAPVKKKIRLSKC